MLFMDFTCALETAEKHIVRVKPNENEASCEFQLLLRTSVTALQPQNNN